MAEELSKLHETLHDYFGQGNELAMGLKIKPEDLIEKPKALTRYEQIHELNIPYVHGGLLDQPYLWMQQHGTIKNFLIEREAIERALAAVNRG